MLLLLFPGPLPPPPPPPLLLLLLFGSVAIVVAVVVVTVVIMISTEEHIIIWKRGLSFPTIDDDHVHELDHDVAHEEGDGKEGEEASVAGLASHNHLILILSDSLTNI